MNAARNEARLHDRTAHTMGTQRFMALVLALACSLSLLGAPAQAVAKDSDDTQSQASTLNSSKNASKKSEQLKPFTGNVLDISQNETMAVDINTYARHGTVFTEVPEGAKVADEDPIPGAASDGSVQAEDGSRVYPTIPFNYLPNPTTEEFIAAIGEQARRIAQENGLYASVMIAQAILESGSGGSGLSKPPYNNLFGIKGSYNGKSVYMWTQEDDGAGNYSDIVSAFRSYPSTAESLEDYAYLLTKSMGSFYAPAWKVNAATYADACDYLQGHYATSTTYSASLQGLILAYDLTQFDNPAESADDAKKGAQYAAAAGRGKQGGSDTQAQDSTNASAGTANNAGSNSTEGNSAENSGVSAAEAAQTAALQVLAFGAAPLAALGIVFARGGAGIAALLRKLLAALPLR